MLYMMQEDQRDGLSEQHITDPGSGDGSLATVFESSVNKVKIERKASHGSKGVYYATGILAVGIIGLFLAVQLNAWAYLQKIILPATAVITVFDNEDSLPISSAELTLDGQHIITDTAGVAIVGDLTAKTYTISISAVGYQTYEADIDVQKGRNNFTFSLHVFVSTTDLGGTVYDYVDGSILRGVTVSYEDQKQTTGEDGGFLFTDVPSGTAHIAVEKPGFLSRSFEVQLAIQYELDVNLVPEGKTVFVSNREKGKRGIYVADFDGGNVSQLIPRVGETEDYDSVMGNNGTYVAFLSTREMIKTASGNSYVPYLYVVSVDGLGLTTVSSHSQISEVSWAQKDEYLVWRGMPDAQSYSYDLFSYSMVDGKIRKLNTSGVVGAFVMSPKKDYVMWSEYKKYDDPTSQEGTYGYSFEKKVTTTVMDQYAWGMVFASAEQVLLQYSDNLTGEEKNAVYQIPKNIIEQQLGPVSTRSIVFSPDGTRSVFVDTRDGKTDIYYLEGSSDKAITSLGTVYGNPWWDPSGSYLLLTSGN